MKLRSTLLALAVLVAVGGVAVLGYRQEPADAKMVVAAQKFLASLDDKQKDTATFPFDSKERTNWWFVPKQDKDKKTTRKGLPLEDMNVRQKTAARELLATLSPVDDPLMDDQLAIELDRRLEESLSDPSSTISWTALKGER